MTTPLVELKGLVKRYEGFGLAPGATVLRGIDLEILAGDSIAVVGPSGSGKSTLLSIMGGLLLPSEGEVLVEGIDLATKTSDELAALRNEKVGFVFQSHHLLPQCSALENVLVPTLVLKDRARRRDAVPRARALLEEVGLGHRMDHPPARLSGGECQRVAVVRAVINQPKLLLADEPTGSLDADASDHLAALLCELNRNQGLALVTVTHSSSLASMMSQVHELREGRLAAPSSGDSESALHRRGSS